MSPASATATRRRTCVWKPGSRSTSPAAGRSKDTAMALIKMKPTSPGTRFVVKIDRSHLHKGGPLESLTTKKNRTGARNHSGRQTTRHIGGGHKQRYRLVDFKRDKDGIPGVVEGLEYDPNSTPHLALWVFQEGGGRHLLLPSSGEGA